eukprot:2789680-Pleurochrysis_carterae.AAC.1
MMNRVGGGSCSEDSGNAAKIGGWLSFPRSSIGAEEPALDTPSGLLGGIGGGMERQATRQVGSKVVGWRLFHQSVGCWWTAECRAG